MEKCRIGCGQGPHRSGSSPNSLSNTARMNARALSSDSSLPKNSDAKMALEDSGRIGHPREMTQLQLPVVPRFWSSVLVQEDFRDRAAPSLRDNRMSAYRAAPRCSRPSQALLVSFCEWHAGGCRRAASQSPRGLWPGRRRTAPARRGLRQQFCSVPVRCRTNPLCPHHALTSTKAQITSAR